MRVARIIEDFLDYRAYVSHTLCQHRLFLGLGHPKSARERLTDAAVWPLAHDESLRLCDLAGTLYGIVPFEQMDTVISGIRRIAAQLADSRTELVDKNNDSALGRFRDLAQSLNGLFRDLHMTLETHTPEFSQEAVLEALSRVTSLEWQGKINDYMRSRLAPIVNALLMGEGNHPTTDLYREFWPTSADGYLLTRTAVVAAASEDLPTKWTGPTRSAQRLLRGTEAVVSCWAPSVTDVSRQEQVEKSIKAQDFASRADLVSRLERGIQA